MSRSGQPEHSRLEADRTACGSSIGRKAVSAVHRPAEWSVPPPDPKQEQRMAVAQIVPAPHTSKPRRRRIADLAMAARLACCTLITGCLLSHRAPDESTAQQPRRLQNTLHADNATGENTAMGTQGTQAERSIKMPDRPYSWQQVGPCGQRYVEKVGGCWDKLENPAPCPEYAVEENDRCYVPVPAKPAKPNTVEPKK